MNTNEPIEYTVTDNSDHITYFTCNLGCELQLCQDGCCDASNCLACHPSTVHNNFDAVLDAITKYDNERSGEGEVKLNSSSTAVHANVRRGDMDKHNQYTVIKVEDGYDYFTCVMGCQVQICIHPPCHSDQCVGCDSGNVHNDLDAMDNALDLYYKDNTVEPSLDYYTEADIERLLAGNDKHKP